MNRRSLILCLSVRINVARHGRTAVGLPPQTSSVCRCPMPGAHGHRQDPEAKLSPRPNKEGCVADF